MTALWEKLLHFFSGNQHDPVPFSSAPALTHAAWGTKGAIRDLPAVAGLRSH